MLAAGFKRETCGRAGSVEVGSGKVSSTSEGDPKCPKAPLFWDCPGWKDAEKRALRDRLLPQTKQ